VDTIIFAGWVTCGVLAGFLGALLSQADDMPAWAYALVGTLFVPLARVFLLGLGGLLR
jgi:fructose-specific phosphotransferase system IIC component